MKKNDLKIIAQKILNAEREIDLGKDVQSNEDKIQNYMSTLSQYDLVQLILLMEKSVDK